MRKNTNSKLLILAVILISILLKSCSMSKQESKVESQRKESVDMSREKVAMSHEKDNEYLVSKQVKKNLIIAFDSNYFDLDFQTFAMLSSEEEFNEYKIFNKIHKNTLAFDRETENGKVTKNQHFTRKKIKLFDGVTNFILPSKMYVDTSYMGYLGISLKLSYSELNKILKETLYQENIVFKNNNDSLIITEGGTEKIKVYPYMKAELRDVTTTSKNFDISTISQDWQRINFEGDSNIVWKWNITPKVEGNHRLQFNIYGSIDDVIETSKGKNILVFNQKVTVNAIKTPLSIWEISIEKIKMINDNWAIMTSGFMGMVLLFFRDKVFSLFKKKEK
jgi:hypothetical protein